MPNDTLKILPSLLGDLPTLGQYTRPQSVISLDFPIAEIPVDYRHTVAEIYKPDEYGPQFAEYVVVARILENNDHLIVPPEYGRCAFMHHAGPLYQPSADTLKAVQKTQDTLASLMKSSI